MIIENPEALKAWLTTVLAPLCDADPAALAKYVLALAKKEKPETELRGAMIDQLDVFLQQETKGFVDLLFETLESKSYLQSNPEPPTAIKTEQNQLVNGTTPAIPNLSSSESEKAAATVEIPAGKIDDKKSELRDSRKKPTDKDDRRPKRRSWSSRSRSRSRSRDRARRSRSRDRNRDRGGRSGWPEDRRSRRSPARRPMDRRGRSRSPPSSSHPPRRSSRSPRTRRAYRTRSRSPKALSPSRRSPVNKLTTESVPSAELPVLEPTLAVAGAAAAAPAPGAAPLAIQSVVVAPIDKRTKFRCRDYDEKGYCMRGDLCPYDHGMDPVVLEDVELSSMLNYSRPPPGAPPVVPPVNVGSLPPPPHLRAPPPSLPPPGEPYNPDAPGISWPPPPFGAGAPPSGPPMMGIRPSLGGRGGGPAGMQGFNGPPPFGPPPRLPPPPHMRGPAPPHMAGRGVSMGLLGAAPPQRELISVPTGMEEAAAQKRSEKEAGLETEASSGPAKKSHFDYSRLGGSTGNQGPPAKRYDPTNCCLEVKKIPRGLNNISVLNNHFSKFGKIVNLQVNFNGDPEGALVTFSSHAEAQAAYRSTEAVLNNRFIKVFWHNKESPEAKGKQENVPPVSKPPVRERLGGVGAGRVLTQSQTPTPAPLDEEALKEASEAKEKERQKAVAAIMRSQEILAAKEALKKKAEEQKREATKLQVDLQRRKQDLLDKQLQQQRVLIERLEKNKTSMKQDDRAAIMQTVRGLQESIEKLKQDLQHTVLKETNAAGTPSGPKATTTAPAAAQVKKSLEEAQRELLDAEIELYQKQQEGSDTTELQKKVLQLKSLSQSVRGGAVRGRGGIAARAALRGIARGRGRGAIVRGGRGRGRAGYYVPPHVSVDRRPTQLKVFGFEASQQGDILAFFANFGEVVDYEVDADVPSLIVRYKSRKDAEMALVQGKVFQETALTVNWFSVPSPSASRKVKEVSDEERLTGQEPIGSTSADEEEEENEGLEDLLNYDEDDEDEVERSWRR